MKFKGLKVEKVLNHNTIICKCEEKDRKYICFGQGIGFKAKVGDVLENDTNIEDYMSIMDDSQVEHYDQLLKKVEDEKLISIVAKVVNAASKHFENKVNMKLHCTLLDHLNFAIVMQKQSITMEYPFITELEYIYPKEYEFSKKALKYINDNYEHQFLESELGFITLHIHAAITDATVSNVVLTNQICYESIKIIEDEFNTMIDAKSIHTLRFKHHLQSAIHRVKNNISITNVMLESIYEQCPEEVVVAEKMAIMLEDKYHIPFGRDEIGYLTLHIYNLVRA